MPLRLVHQQLLVLALQLGNPKFTDCSEPGVIVILRQHRSVARQPIAKL
jgi:hypothetical protein